MPIGIPGWPELAACTASIANARIALAINVTGMSDNAGGALALFTDKSFIRERRENIEW
jgi:hypothetical protein